jgi:Tol biopolymer transport system component
VLGRIVRHDVAQMSTRLLVSGLVVVLVLVLGNAAGATVNAFPTEGRLVFSCTCLESDGSGWLFTMAPDGRGLRTLPRTNGSSYPRWSPDGRTIAFARDFLPAQSIWLYSVAESKARRLTRPLGGTSDDSPAWSPRADVLAFVRGGAALLRLESASGKSTVVRSGRTTLFQPDWSPDGSRIAGTRAGGELWQVNTDGSGLRRLAARRIRGELPRWSPDRGRVAFSFTPVNDPASLSVRILNLRSGSGKDSVRTT